MSSFFTIDPGTIGFVREAWKLQYRRATLLLPMDTSIAVKLPAALKMFYNDDGDWPLFSVIEHLMALQDTCLMILDASRTTLPFIFAQPTPAEQAKRLQRLPRIDTLGKHWYIFPSHQGLLRHLELNVIVLLQWLKRCS
jgi:hypothetical protein